MAEKGSKRQLALDTNLVLDLAAESDFARRLPVLERAAATVRKEE